MLVRIYALVVGAVLIVVGVVGLVLGNRVWLGLLNVDILEDLVHLITGGLLVYAGITRDLGVARALLAALGVIYLMLGVLGFAAPEVFGLIPHGYTVFDNLLHLVLGGFSLWVAFSSRAGTLTGRSG